MDEEAKRGGETAGFAVLKKPRAEITGVEFSSLTTGN